MTDKPMFHFEQLWEKCEAFHKDSNPDENTSSILEEMTYKIEMYKSLDSSSQIPEDEKQKAKSRIMGEILLTLTNLSLRDNINVFDALGVALQFRSIKYFDQKY